MHHSLTADQLRALINLLGPVDQIMVDPDKTEELRDLLEDLLEEVELAELDADPAYQAVRAARFKAAGWKQVDGKVVRARP